MPKKAKVSNEVIESAMEAVQKAKTSDELRMAQSVVVPALLDVPDHVTSQIVGRSRVTVVRLRKQFAALKESPTRKRGGRRYGYMTIEQERQFLSHFLDQASDGGILVVSEIQRAFESLVGRRVAKTTIYRLLDRHDWRTIIPRPRHPNSNTEAREGFKKTPKKGD